MNSWLSQLHWHQPLWLLLATLPWLLLAWRHHRGPENKLRGFADEALWQWLVRGDPQRSLRSTAMVLAWTLASVAAAGPYWLPKDASPAQQRGADIVVIIDISPSMSAADVTPSRLARVKKELRDFTQLLGSDRLGLVAFSANAYPVLPLSGDHDAFLRFVDLLDPSLTERPGSNLTRALEVAGHLLRHSAKDSRAMVLLSDGEYHDPDAVPTAQRLRADHIPLFVIGVGSDAGAPVPNDDGHFIQDQGHTVISKLNRNELQAVARAAQGSYFDLSDDDSEWRAILNELRARTRAALHAAGPANLQGIALYPGLLALSLALFLWSGLRRRESLALWLLPVLLLGHPIAGHAAPWKEQQAYDALQKGDYRQAQNLYAGQDDYGGRLGAGVAAYRLQNWQAALTAFKHATAHAGNEEEKATALYNTGNALAQLHRFEAASNAYRAALGLKPDFAKAALNLSLVNQFLDARNGEQQRKDKKQPLSPQVGAAHADADELDRQRRGKDRETTSSSGESKQSSEQHQSGAAAGQHSGGTTPHEDDNEERLRQTLAMWHDHTSRGGGAPQLEALRDNSKEFLRMQFRNQDYGPKTMIIEGKPW